jgi:DegV family protein with EDD domain
VATDRPVAIVTDSTADIPADLAAANDIIVVPLNVTIDGKTYQATELTQADFFARMNAARELPTTSQASVGTFVEVYARALETAKEVVSIHISSKLSGTIESAYAAAEQFGGRVHVFDSLNLSWGLGFQALEAARSAAKGASVADVLEHTERIRERVRMIVGLDKLDNLAKGGRIGAVSAFLGGLLNLKVTLTVTEEGVFAPVARTRGRTAALEHTVEWVRGHMGDAKSGAICVMHAMSPDNAEWLRSRLEQTLNVTEMHVVEVGVVIATHTGTGWGVAVVPAG